MVETSVAGSDPLQELDKVTSAGALPSLLSAVDGDAAPRAVRVHWRGFSDSGVQSFALADGSAADKLGSQALPMRDLPVGSVRAPPM